WAMEGGRYPRRRAPARRECRHRAAVLAVERTVPGYAPPLMLSRRHFLGLPLLFAAGRSFAFGEQARFSFAQIRHAGRWDPRPDGLSRLAWEIAKRTSIETSPVVKAMGLA